MLAGVNLQARATAAPGSEVGRISYGSRWQSSERTDALVNKDTSIPGYQIITHICHIML